MNNAVFAVDCKPEITISRAVPRMVSLKEAAARYCFLSCSDNQCGVPPAPCPASCSISCRDIPCGAVCFVSCKPLLIVQGRFVRCDPLYVLQAL